MKRERRRERGTKSEGRKRTKEEKGRKRRSWKENERGKRVKEKVIERKRTAATPSRGVGARGAEVGAEGSESKGIQRLAKEKKNGSREKQIKTGKSKFAGKWAYDDKEEAGWRLEAFIWEV